MSNPNAPEGILATPVLRPAQRSSRTHGPAGNQPAHISLDHASCNDTLTPASPPTGPLPRNAAQHDVVLAGVKAKPPAGVAYGQP